MKFTQSDAFKKIKGILTKGGKDLQMSERSIMEQLDVLTALVANDDMELDDFIGKVENTFKTMNANAKKDYSDFANKWKAEHEESADKSKEDEKSKSTDGDGTIAALRAELASIKAMVEQSTKESKIESKRKELRTKLKEKGVKDDKWLDILIRKAPISDETDVESETEEYLTLYNSSRSETPANVTPGSVNSGDSNKLSESIKQASEMAKRMAEQRAALSTTNETN